MVELGMGFMGPTMNEYEPHPQPQQAQNGICDMLMNLVHFLWLHATATSCDYTNLGFGRFLLVGGRDIYSSEQREASP